MSNYHLKDKALSLKSKGLLSVMLSLPEDWDYTLKGLACISKDGVDAIREAVRELERAGYIVRTRMRNEKGQLKNTEYKLLKYYTEHYRIQKYAPNSGYVHFLFNDMCPQSFYGIYDWWCLPKAGLDAMLESNMPLGVFLKYSRDHVDGIYAINDDLQALGEVQVKYVFTDENGDVIESKTLTLNLGADDAVHVCDVALKVEDHRVVNCALLLMKDNKVLCYNHYEDLFNMPAHVEGHPQRMSHEIGMRLYFA